MSTQDLAKLLNLKSIANIYSWERGILTPSLPLAVRLSKIFDINLKTLTFGRDPKIERAVRFARCAEPKFRGPEHEAFCNLLRNKRLDLRLTHDQVAKEVKAERKTIICWENGHHIPGHKHLKGLERLFKFSIKDFPQVDAIRKKGLSRSTIQRLKKALKENPIQKSDQKWQKLMYNESLPTDLAKGLS
jgi:DNA-binding XRE family transcriptional regulator